MFEHIIDILAPHHCVGCKTSGSILCEACSLLFNDIPACCYKCEVPTASSWVCKECKKDNVVNDVWIVATYDELMKAAISAYKFKGARSGYRSLADLIESLTPILPQDNLTVTAIPTIASHQRQRGYDHSKLLAREVARQRSLPFLSLLTRIDNRPQIGASRRQRHAQALTAYAYNHRHPPPEIVLLIDDVITTGSTIEATAKVLKKAGVKTVFVAALAFEPLRK